jgi:hypothetical protein
MNNQPSYLPPPADLMARLAAHQPGRRLTVTSENELRISAATP